MPLVCRLGKLSYEYNTAYVDSMTAKTTGVMMGRSIHTRYVMAFTSSGSSKQQPGCGLESSSDGVRDACAARAGPLYAG